MAGKLDCKVRGDGKRSRGRHGDGNGLYLVVKPSGAKSWVLRTVVHGRRCDIGLGGYPLVALAEAREAAFDNRKLAPCRGRPAGAKAAIGHSDFRGGGPGTVIEIHRPTWRDGGKSPGQWTSSLRQYALSASRGQTGGTRSPRRDVMAVLLPIWTEKTENCSTCSPAHQRGHEVGSRARVSRRQSRRRRPSRPRCRRLSTSADTSEPFITPRPAMLSEP